MRSRCSIFMCDPGFKSSSVATQWLRLCVVCEETWCLFIPVKRKESLSNANDPLCAASHMDQNIIWLLILTWACEYFFSHAHTHTHTLFFYHTMDFHNSYLLGVISGNQLGGIYLKCRLIWWVVSGFCCSSHTKGWAWVCWGRRQTDKSGAAWSLWMDSHLV